MEKLLLFSVVLLVTVTTTGSLDNGLARTPPMGWMNWTRFWCNYNCTEQPGDCINETLFMQMADVMAKEGYLDAGYEYVHLADCWTLQERGPDGRLIPDPYLYPSGMKALADYIHSKGLKFGMYLDMGMLTCQRYPGSKFFLELDAQTLAGWGVDMVMLDCCYHGTIEDLNEGFSAMSLFLNLTGRPMLYSCAWPLCAGESADYALIRKHCNMWRNYKDMRDIWDNVYNTLDFYGNDTLGFSKFAGPGGWNDPDQIMLGNYGLSHEQERVQMGMWCMLAAPLMMSVDLRNMRASSKALLLNKNLLRIHRDELSIPAYRFLKGDHMEVWLRPLEGKYFRKGSWAVAVVNTWTHSGPQIYSSTLDSLGLRNQAGYQINEAFDGGDMGILYSNGTLKFEVNQTGIFMVTAVPLV